jgi:hypothetical protein
MKKIIFSLIFISAIFFSTNCKKDKSTSTSSTSPMLTLSKGTGYIYCDTLVNAGQPIKFGVHAVKGNDGSNLSHLKIERIYGSSITTCLDTAINTVDYAINAYIISRSESGTEKIKIIVTDGSGKTNEINIMVTTIIIGPVINFIHSPGNTTNDTTVKSGTILTVRVSCTKYSTGQNLSRFKIVRVFTGNSTTEFDTTLDCPNLALTRFLITRPVNGTEQFIFEAYDKDGFYAEKILNITTRVPYGPIVTWTNRSLGDQNSTFFGSYFSSLTGLIYNQTAAQANASNIDISFATLYGMGAESFVSPSERGTYGLPTYTGAQVTYFCNTSLTGGTFNSLSNDSILRDLPVPNSKTVSISSFQVILFVTSSGKKGLIRNNSLGSGLITFDVKVQQ